MTLTHRLALAGMFAAAAAFAQTGTPSTGSAETGKSAAKSDVKMSPSAVLSMIHQVNQDEIKLGKSAQAKAQSDKVKDYAKDMVDDHTALDKKLTDFVQKEGNGKLTLSSSQIPASKLKEMKHSSAATVHTLSSATGAAFDREYVSAMLKGHDAVLSDLDAALPSLESKAKLHDFVSDARDKVKDHRDHARDLLKDLEGTTATGGSGMQGSGATTGARDTAPQSVGGGAPGATTGTRATGTTSTTPPDPGTTTAPSTTGSGGR
jgi:putative membrane protein